MLYSIIFLYLAIYVGFLVTGYKIYKHRKLRAWLSGIGILILVSIFSFISSLFKSKSGAVPEQAYGGIAEIFFSLVAIVILLPILGFLSGIFSRYFFEKAQSSSGYSLIQNIIGVLILGWPFVTMAVVAIITYPELQRQKDERIAFAEERAVQRAEDKRIYEEKKQAEIKLYENKQKDHVYSFKLADNDIDLKAFKYLRVSFNSEAPYDRGLRIWGNALEDYQNTNGIIANNGIYRIYVQTNIIKDDCPNTDLEIALIWCREHKVANAINYRPNELGRLVFEKQLKKTQLDLVLSYAKTGLSGKPSGITPIPFNEERIWRINKTSEFETIYSDIYLTCRRLSEREKSRGYGGKCYIGFRLNEDIFVNMYIPIKSKIMIESDSRSAVRQSLKYWDLIHN